MGRLDRVELYVQDVLDGRRVVGRLERLAVERHVADLAEGGSRSLRFNRQRAARALWWIEERLRFSKGEWAGKPFRLEPWQAFVVASLFGWEREVDGVWLRRFRTGYLSVARKNGKTELLAAIGLLMLTTGGAATDANGAGRPEHGAEIYSAATTKDQASIAWKAADSIVRRSPSLSSHVVRHPSRYNLAFPHTDSFFRALAADADTLDGLNPYGAIVDELHAHKDGTVWDVLGSGMGARREPLLCAITTAGADRDGVCGEVEGEAIKVLDRVYVDDSLFAFICRLDESDDPFDESVWPKSNPNLGVSVILDGLRIAAKTAAQNPARRNEFLRKRMNLWTTGDTAWMGLNRWDACTGAVDLDELRGKPCYLAFDLGSTNDTTSVVAAWPLGDGAFAVHPWVFVPADTLADTGTRGPRERELLTRWVRDGLVTATSGDIIDFDAIWHLVLNATDRYEVRAAVFDRWQASSLIGKCEAVGLEVVAFGQGYKSMSPAIKELEALIGKRKLVHGGNPVLRWMVSNAAVRTDPAGNVKFDKSKRTHRIDAVVAMAMAVGHATTVGDEGDGLFVHMLDDASEETA